MPQEIIFFAAPRIALPMKVNDMLIEKQTAQEPNNPSQFPNREPVKPDPNPSQYPVRDPNEVPAQSPNEVPDKKDL